MLHLHDLIYLILMTTYQVRAIIIPSLQMMIERFTEGNNMHKTTQLVSASVSWDSNSGLSDLGMVA